MRNLAPAAKPKKKKGSKSTSVFDVGQTSTRHRSNQDLEVYMSLFYEDRVSKLVRARCEAENIAGVPIWLIREVSKERFASEEQTIIDAVDKEIARRAEAAEATATALMAEEESERTPQEYQQ